MTRKVRNGRKVRNVRKRSNIKKSKRRTSRSTPRSTTRNTKRNTKRTRNRKRNKIRGGGEFDEATPAELITMLQEQYEEFLRNPGQTRLGSENIWSVDYSQRIIVIIGLHCLAKKTQAESLSAGVDFTPLSMDQDFMKCIIRTVEHKSLGSASSEWAAIVKEAKLFGVGGEELEGTDEEKDTFIFKLSILQDLEIIVVEDKARAGRIVTGLTTDAATTRIIRTVIEYARGLDETDISDLQRRLNDGISTLRMEQNPDAVIGARAARGARLAAQAAKDQVAQAEPASDSGY